MLNLLRNPKKHASPGAKSRSAPGRGTMFEVAVSVETSAVNVPVSPH